MGYTALEKMRDKNTKKYGRELGPINPSPHYCDADDGRKAAVLRFIRERCEGLGFDEATESEEDRTGIYKGRSLKRGQIPYNMQMDINRLCLEREMEKFMDSDTVLDAYTVCYCFLEIFCGHLNKDEKIEKIGERYVCSVRRFAEGIREYAENNKADCSRDALFLEEWGRATLLEDDYSSAAKKYDIHISGECDEDEEGAIFGDDLLHLDEIAAALNYRYTYNGTEDEALSEDIAEAFDSLSLEYQLSNINQAKNFLKYLDVLGCYYSDKEQGEKPLEEFDSKQLAVFAPMEHERWVREHISMGWIPGDIYKNNDERECLRMHKEAMDPSSGDEEISAHYDSLPRAEKEKDYEPFNSMIKLIKKYDGLTIYKKKEPAKHE